MHAPFRSSVKKILSASSNSILPTSDTLLLMSGEHALQSDKAVKKEQNNERGLLMKNVKAHDKNEQLTLSSLRVFPADAYPQKYVIVFSTIHRMRQKPFKRCKRLATMRRAFTS